VGTVCLKDVSIDLFTFFHVWKGKAIWEISNHQRAAGLRNLEDLYVMLKLESVFLSKKTRIEQESIFILGSFPNNYFHWLIQMLPRISIVENNPLLKDLPIVLPKDMKKYVKESLEIIGYLDKVIFLDIGVYQFDKLHVCTPLWIEHPDITYSQTIEWLRRNFIKQESYSQKRRIYISRKDVTERNITNESDLEPILNEYGFEIITLSNYSVAEQVQLFQEAEMIIGVHGAGLSNLVFATPGCVVIEVFIEKASKRPYSHISQMIGLKYGFLIGSKDGNGVYVEAEKFQQIIEQGFSYLNCENRISAQ
jgi:capsular polysaccharide biosynthesis protein